MSLRIGYLAALLDIIAIATWIAFDVAGSAVANVDWVSGFILVLVFVPTLHLVLFLTLFEVSTYCRSGSGRTAVQNMRHRRIRYAQVRL